MWVVALKQRDTRGELEITQVNGKTLYKCLGRLLLLAFAICTLGALIRADKVSWRAMQRYKM